MDKNQEVKIEDEEGKQIIANLKDFKINEVLSYDIDQKCIIYLGQFSKDAQQDNKDQSKQAILILFKKSFPQSDLEIAAVQKSEQYFHNDIFRRYTMVFDEKYSEIDFQVIYPATEKFIKKYQKGILESFQETKEMYQTITKELILKDAQTSLQWVYNILEGKKEKENVFYRNEDPQQGFILTKDYAFKDIKKLESFHALAIVNRRDIYSLRDVGANELSLLKSIYKTGIEEIEREYGIKRNQLRIFVHYQPTFYHFHVHFVSIEKFNKSMGPERAHLLSDIIQIMDIAPNYYKDFTASMILSDSQPLYHLFKKNQEQ